MTDRELLGLAAKAAGIELNGASIAPIYMDMTDHVWVRWNPLENDGDAMRLAVKLSCNIVIDEDMGWVGVRHSGRLGKYGAGESLVPDRYIATRRAIVRAAAELAKLAAAQPAGQE